MRQGRKKGRTQEGEKREAKFNRVSHCFGPHWGERVSARLSRFAENILSLTNPPLVQDVELLSSRLSIGSYI
jgi:hypothetical protein